jgi:probable F420-dependent oxidoreductase
MRFSIGLATDQVEQAEEFVNGEAVMECARAVERFGYDACFVTDHPAPDAKWLANGGHHALDPFVALSFAAAATTRLRVQTHVMILAYRNPFLAAKSVLSLDVLSGGRVILGVAAGYLRPEFAALGVDFDERNELTEESIDIIRQVLTTDAVAVDGRHFRSRGTTMRPRTPQQPHPPIWIGGNSTTAIKRAAERGQGWVPFRNPASIARTVRTPELSTIDDLARRLDLLRAHVDEIGRTEPLDVCFGPFTAPDGSNWNQIVDEIHTLEQLGVTWCVGGAEVTKGRTAYLESAQEYAENVLAKFDSSS